MRNVIVFILILTMMLSFGGCGSKSETSTMDNSGLNTEATTDTFAPEFSMDSINSMTSSPGDAGAEMQEEGFYEESLPLEDTSSTPTNDVNYNERKIVYTASINIETKDMDTFLANVNKTIEEYGAYVSSQYEYNDGTIDRPYRNRSVDMTIRIPSDNFDKFISGIEERDDVHVLSVNKDSQDYSEQYYDKESRLEALEVQEKRLIDMLSDAQDVDIMLKTEKYLAEVQYEIDSLTSELKFIDSQVDYSTISLYVSEVVEYERIYDEPETFLTRIKIAIEDSFENFIDSAENLIVSAIYIIPYAIIIILIVISVRFKLKHIKKNKNDKKE